MESYGNFDLGFPFDDEILSDEELDQILATLDEESFLVPTDQPRFKVVNDQELQVLEDGNQSKSTWFTLTISDWCMETGTELVDFSVVSSVDLAEKLRRFYAVAKPRKGNKNDGWEYHRNSMKNLRAALNRHLRDMGRDIDIVRDREFHKSNALLNGSLDVDTPWAVLYRAWYLIAVHFVSRGLEFHPQLLQTSFKFHFDDEGREYASLCHDPAQKTTQGGLNDPEPQPDKRIWMYASIGAMCPVSTLKLLLKKSNPLALHLFCLPKPSVTTADSIWYTPKPLSQRKFQSIMPTISKEAGLSRVFTAHSLRATAITALNDAGVELRHIMFMSGHRNESSIRSYNRGCSATQKRKMSDVIQSTFVPSCDKPATSTSSSTLPSPSTSTCLTTEPFSDNESNAVMIPCNELSRHSPTSSLNPNSMEIQAPSPSSRTINSSVTALNYNFPSSAGLMPKGIFNNCTFNIYTK